MLFGLRQESKFQQVRPIKNKKGWNGKIEVEFEEGNAECAWKG
jgi:hypothetical protein